MTLHGAPDWTPAGRKDLADWLRRQAKNLVKDGTKYSKRFTAKYIAR
jgi:hypothetical protein